MNVWHVISMHQATSFWTSMWVPGFDPWYWRSCFLGWVRATLNQSQSNQSMSQQTVNPTMSQLTLESPLTWMTERNQDASSEAWSSSTNGLIDAPHRNVARLATSAVGRRPKPQNVANDAKLLAHWWRQSPAHLPEIEVRNNRWVPHCMSMAISQIN